MDKMTGAEMAQGRYRTPHEISTNYLGVRRRSVGGYPRCHRLTRVHETLRDAVPGSTTMAAAMAQSGIWDACRAAAVYQVLFGQTTLDSPHKVPRFAVVREPPGRLGRKRA
jgi:hypothetical protein